ncbi:hypothetical protein GGI07_002950 [Coemansia sp. Benny D115]|nr:hypothetical protein GGI07_002950 [Coemansia sp. Benny D115]
MGASKTLSKDAAVNAMQSTEASVLPEEYCKLDSDKYVFVNKVHTETSTAGNVSNACCTKSRKAFELNEKFNARRSWINSIKAKWIALRHRRKARQAKTSKASKASETSESAAKEISATSTIPDISSESAVPEISTVPVLQEVSEKTE